MHVLPDLLLRAAHLLALAIAPPLFSPAPSTAQVPPAAAIAAGLVLVALIVGAGRLRHRLPGPHGLAAAALLGAAVAAAVVAGDVFQGDRGPLGRGVVYVAVPLWAGLAVVAGAVAERRLRIRRARIAGAALVVALGGGLFAASMGDLSSPERMWIAALRHDGDDSAAVDALIRVPLHARKYDAVIAVLDRCRASAPRACACVAGRVEVALHTLPSKQAIDEAVAASQRCPDSASMRAALAETLAFHGDPEQAEQAARAGLQRSDDARLHYALCLALDREGRAAEAIEEAKRAVKLGAGRDASLALGSMCITSGDLATAEEALRAIVAADLGDADAQFDLALVADKRNDYNRAREAYLTTLRVDPRYAAARNNLVYLTFREGALDEARHHAERFAAAFPDDPRGPVLARLVAAASAAPKPQPHIP